MRSRKIIHLPPDVPDITGSAAVEPDTLVKDHPPHRLFLHIVVVFLDHVFMSHQVKPLFSLMISLVLHNIFVAKILKSLHALMLVGNPLPDNFIAGSIQLSKDLGFQGFVVGLVAVLPLDHIKLSHYLLLHQAMLFDLFVGKFDGFEHFGF